MGAQPAERQDPYIVAPDGWAGRTPLGADEQAALWARCLHTGRPGLVEVAVGRRDRRGALRMRSRSDRRRFPAAGDLGALIVIVRLPRSRGEKVFATPLTRRLAKAGRDGEVLPGRVVWTDIDHERALEALRAFPHRPRVVVVSGSGGAHAYWRLIEEQTPAAIERANRMLCDALGGDLASTDAARIMRLPGTVNHKAGKPCRLLYVDLARRGLALDELVDGLEDLAPPAPPPSAELLARRRQLAREDPAGAIVPPVYFRVLAGVEVPERGSHVPCPLPDHADEVASCRLYATAEEGWRCFGCGRGGAIYDLASLLAGGVSGRALRGKEFREVTRRVRDALGVCEPT